MQSRGLVFFTLHDIYLCVVHLFVSALLNYIAQAEIQPGGFKRCLRAMTYALLPNVLKRKSPVSSVMASHLWMIPL